MDLRSFLRPSPSSWVMMMAMIGAVFAADPSAGSASSRPPREQGQATGDSALDKDASHAGASHDCALDEGVEALIEGLLVAEERPEARRRLLELGAAAVPALLDHAKRGDVDFRVQLIDLQGTIHDPRSLPALARNVTHDENPRVRWQSVAALSKYPDHVPAIDLLLHDLATGDETLQWNAAVGLSMFGRADGLELLHDGILSADAWRRWEAVNALGQVHDETTARVVGQLFLSPIVDDRENAVLALAQIGDGNAFLLLLSALKDEAAGVRWRACMALGRGDRLEAILSLHSLKLRETDPRVLEHAERAIQRLEALL